MPNQIQNIIQSYRPVDQSTFIFFFIMCACVWFIVDSSNLDFVLRRIRPLTFPFATWKRVRKTSLNIVSAMSCISIRERKSTSKFILYYHHDHVKTEMENAFSSQHNHSIFTTVNYALIFHGKTRFNFISWLAFFSSIYFIL